jgi:hypothetical protein
LKAQTAISQASVVALTPSVSENRSISPAVQGTEHRGPPRWRRSFIDSAARRPLRYVEQRGARRKRCRLVVMSEASSRHAKWNHQTR